MENAQSSIQEKSIVGRVLPEFVADALSAGAVIRLSSLDLYGKYLLFFFYSADFSNVCPTEMHALQEALPEFKKRGVEVIGVSVDPIQTHIAWLQTPASKGGIEGVTFTLISDVQKQLSRAYGILDEQKGYSLRGTFIVDQMGIVQYASVNSFEIGRNIVELIRIVDAIQFVEEHGELCPVNWSQGKDALKMNSTI